MTIKNIKVSYGRTVNLGNYESLRLDLSLEIERSLGDDTRDLIEEAKMYLRNEMAIQIEKEVRYLRG